MPVERSSDATSQLHSLVEGIILDLVGKYVFRLRQGISIWLQSWPMSTWRPSAEGERRHSPCSRCMNSVRRGSENHREPAQQRLRHADTLRVEV